MVKYIRQRDEDQAWSLSCLDAVSRTCRENDKSCHKRYQRVKDQYIDCLAGQAALFIDITSKNRHRTDTDTQRKERLSQRRKYDLADTNLLNLAKIRL